MTLQDEWVEFHATLATSERINAYGGFRFSPEVLERFAEAMNQGAIPMNVQHDLRRPLRVRNTACRVIRGSDGLSRLQMTGQIHAADWADSSAMTGMSITVVEPISSNEWAEEGGALAWKLACDSAWFTDESILEAGALLPRQIEISRVYQFSFVPDPQVFIEIVGSGAFQAVAAGLVSNALSAAIGALFARRRTPPGAAAETPTRVSIIVEDGARKVSSIIETNDADSVNRAIDSFGGAISMISASPRSPDQESPKILNWDPSCEEWTPPA